LRTKLCVIFIYKTITYMPMNSLNNMHNLFFDDDESTARQ